MAEIYAFATDEYFAKLPGVRSALRRTAHAGAARASAILAAHHHSGDAEINVTHGELDYFVNLDDTRGQSAAAAIEYGRKGGRRGRSAGIHALRSAF
jgi:hypothetical protein